MWKVILFFHIWNISVQCVFSLCQDSCKPVSNGSDLICWRVERKDLKNCRSKYPKVQLIALNWHEMHKYLERDELLAFKDLKNILILPLNSSDNSTTYNFEPKDYENPKKWIIYKMVQTRRGIKIRIFKDFMKESCCTKLQNRNMLNYYLSLEDLKPWLANCLSGFQKQCAFLAVKPTERMLMQWIESTDTFVKFMNKFCDKKIKKLYGQIDTNRKQKREAETTATNKSNAAEKTIFDQKANNADSVQTVYKYSIEKGGSEDKRESDDSELSNTQLKREVDAKSKLKYDYDDDHNWAVKKMTLIYIFGGIQLFLDLVIVGYLIYRCRKSSSLQDVSFTDSNSNERRTKEKLANNSNIIPVQQNQQQQTPLDVVKLPPPRQAKDQSWQPNSNNVNLSNIFLPKFQERITPIGSLLQGHPFLGSNPATTSTTTTTTTTTTTASTASVTTTTTTTIAPTFTKVNPESNILELPAKKNKRKKNGVSKFINFYTRKKNKELTTGGEEGEGVRLLTDLGSTTNNNNKSGKINLNSSNSLTDEYFHGCYGGEDGDDGASDIFEDECEELEQIFLDHLYQRMKSGSFFQCPMQRMKD